MKQYVIAAIAGISLASLAAVGAFASEPLTALVGEEPTATEVATATPEATETPSDATATPEATETPSGATETPEATATPGDATPTPGATETSEPEATETPAPEATPTAADGDDDGDGERDVKGIPTHNPSHTDDDGDGICEKGETKIKTTPSGNEVRVPCHAGKDDEEESSDEN